MKPSLRFAVLERDGFRCVYCNAAGTTELQVDHIVPVAKGGKDSYYNLATACWECNSGKSSRELGHEAIRAIKAKIHGLDHARAREAIKRIPKAVAILGTDDEVERAASCIGSPLLMGMESWLESLEWELRWKQFGPLDEDGNPIAGPQ